MKVYPEKLKAELGRKIAPIYVVSGDEPLLVQEACDEIRSSLRDAGYSEREVFHADGKYDWEPVLFSANSMSLFAEKKVLDIRLPGGKPGDQGAEAIKGYVENLPDDTVLLLVLPRVDASTQRTKWFKALEGAGVFVQVWPIELDKFPRWLADRFKRAGLSADREAIDAMADRSEGNLLAAVQEIERLRLVSKSTSIGEKEVLDGVADSSRFDIFSLIDAAVSQQPARALKIVSGLKLEGASLPYITAMFSRELRSLVAMAFSVQKGQAVDQVTSKVWPAKRKSIVGKCLRNHSPEHLLEIQQSISTIDKLSKGIGKEDPWTELNKTVLALAGKPVTSEGARA